VAARSAIAAVVIVLIALAGAVSAPGVAIAGRSATGEAAFRPCTNCHPVTLGPDGKPTKPLPNKFKKHEITLEVHDVLGAGGTACLACHDAPSRNPGKLVLPDGALVDIDGDVSRVCQRCHFEKYQAWKAGIHGKNEPKCSAAGCHDPHTPSWIYVPALPPFQGTGMEVRAVSDREPFKPMASPPVAPAPVTPGWLQIVTTLGGLAALGALAYVIRGGKTR